MSFSEEVLTSGSGSGNLVLRSKSDERYVSQGSLPSIDSSKFSQTTTEQTLLKDPRTLLPPAPLTPRRSPSPEPRCVAESEVRDWLVRNSLAQYSKALTQAGYDDLEDFFELVTKDPEQFAALIPAPGHQAKIRRMVRTGGLTPSRTPNRLGSTPHRPGGEEQRSNDHTPNGRAKSPNPTMRRSPSYGELSLSPNPRGGTGGGTGVYLDSSSPQRVRRPSGIDLAPEPVNLKVIIVGPPAVGKTSFIRRLVDNSFIDRQPPTIGVDYFTKKYIVGHSQIVTLQLWDIWGQDSCSQISRSVFVGAKGAVIMYNSNDEHSLASAADWKLEVDSKVGSAFPGRTLPSILIGNQCDRPTEQRVLKTKEEVNEYANKLKFMDHRYTSAKTGEGVQSSMEFLLAAMLKSDPLCKVDSNKADSVVTLDDKLKPQKIVPDYSKRNKKKTKGRCNVG